MGANSTMGHCHGRLPAAQLRIMDTPNHLGGGSPLWGQCQAVDWFKSSKKESREENMWHNVDTDDANDTLLCCLDMRMSFFRDISSRRNRCLTFCATHTFKLSIDFYSTSIKEAKPEIPLKTLKIKHLNRCNRKALKLNADILRDSWRERPSFWLLAGTFFQAIIKHDNMHIFELMLAQPTITVKVEAPGYAMQYSNMFFKSWILVIIFL